MMNQMDRLLMIERERILLQADHQMAQIEKTRRDSVLRGRGYSLALGTASANNGPGDVKIQVP